MSIFKSCHRCIKPYDECNCEVFKGLESAYDQPNAKGFVTPDANFNFEAPIDLGSDHKEVDLGSHYRHSFMGHKIDVYRVLEIFDVTDPVAQHIVKKLLRGEKKGHKMDFVWDEVKQAVERKFEMMEEDK